MRGSPDNSGPVTSLRMQEDAHPVRTIRAVLVIEYIPYVRFKTCSNLVSDRWLRCCSLRPIGLMQSEAAPAAFKHLQ